MCMHASAMASVATSVAIAQLRVTHNPVQIVTGWYLSTLKAKGPGLIAYKRRFGNNTTEGGSSRSIDLQSKRIAVFGSERLSVS